MWKESLSPTYKSRLRRSTPEVDHDDDYGNDDEEHEYDDGEEHEDDDDEENAGIGQNCQNDPPSSDCGGGFDKKGNIRLLR